MQLPFESRSYTKGPTSVGSRPGNRSGVRRFPKKWATRLGIALIGIALCGFLHAQPAVPTLVQHVATGMDRWPATTLAINLPNPVGGGNALILGVQFNSVGSIASVSDNQGNTWVAGPAV
ncbi:MAG: hypothetical protein WAK31_14530, partial [Chthoniobacterales bacterium]